MKSPGWFAFGAAALRAAAQLIPWEGWILLFSFGLYALCYGAGLLEDEP